MDHLEEGRSGEDLADPVDHSEEDHSGEDLAGLEEDRSEGRVGSEVDPCHPGDPQVQNRELDDPDQDESWGFADEGNGEHQGAWHREAWAIFDPPRCQDGTRGWSHHARKG